MENNNLELINKLVNGVNNVENVTITRDNGEELTVSLRPLSSGELSELKALENKAYNLNMDLNMDGKAKNQDTNTAVDVDLSKQAKYQSDVVFNAIARSMSHNGVEIKPKHIRAMEKDIPELLFVEVMRISRLTEHDLKTVKTFRL